MSNKNNGNFEKCYTLYFQNHTPLLIRLVTIFMLPKRGKHIVAALSVRYFVRQITLKLLLAF